MDLDPQRIEEDLRGLVRGEVRGDEAVRRLYATDASIYEETPIAVVLPRLQADVAAVMGYASQHGIPVHPRGAGSGLAGGAVGPGIVVDFARYMRRVISIGHNHVCVQPGCTLAELNRELAPHGRLFGPDPSAAEVTTLGGMVGVNGSGSHLPVYGATRDHVRRVTVVLADGAIETFAQHGPVAEEGETPRVRELARSVRGLAQRRRNLLEDRRPKTVSDSSGYALSASTTEGTTDLARLMVGSEGTLALVVEMELATQTPPSATALGLLVFDSLDKSAKAAQLLAPLGVSACDLMDRRHLSLARDLDVRYELMIPGAAESLLLVEFFADDARQARDRLAEAFDLALTKSALAAGSLVAEDALDRELFWNLARHYAPTLQRARGVRRPAPGIEDIAVPPQALPVFLRHAQETLRRHQVTASIFGHAAHGQLHIRPFLDLHKAEDVATLETLASELLEKAWLLGGTMSGEHGDGRSRATFAGRQHGPALAVFRELKQIFDPDGLLNPGKKLPESGARFDQPLRYIPLPVVELSGASANPVPATWSAAEASAAAHSCNGCGGCRSRAAALRMCPIFRFTPREEAAPRAKANLLRTALTQSNPSELLQSEGGREVAELCVHCHMCRLECPAEVDIPRMAVEIKAAQVASRGLSTGEWWAANLDRVSAWGARNPRLANWALRSRLGRWALGRFFDLSPSRRLPRVESAPFLDSAESSLVQPATPRGRVLYFVDTYANYYDHELGGALLAVLEHCGVAVECPAEQQSSALPLIHRGLIEPARRIAQRNVELLAEAIRRGCTIVATEPAAVLALTHEYVWLLGDDPDARLVAEHTREACHYLWGLHQRGVLPLDLSPLEGHIAYHVPCHVRALGVGVPTQSLLGLIPNLRVSLVDKGCSGMAGSFGLLKSNYRTSLRVGLPLLSALREGQYDYATTECGACKLQMENASPLTTLHPIKLLAASYGLAPAIESRLAKLKLGAP